MKGAPALFIGAAAVGALLGAVGGIWRLLAGSGAVQGAAPGSCSDAALRARVVAVARSQVGKGLQDAYLADAAPDFVGERPEWCGIFALWCLHQAGLGRDVTWVVAKGFLFRLPRTSTPEPGDIAYYLKWQHQAVVLDVEGDSVSVANGNGTGGVVSLGTRPLADAEAYYSVRPWLAAAVAKGCPP